jgi:hypothetical protein
VTVQGPKTRRAPKKGTRSVKKKGAAAPAGDVGPMKSEGPAEAGPGVQPAGVSGGEAEPACSGGGASSGGGAVDQGTTVVPAVGCETKSEVEDCEPSGTGTYVLTPDDLKIMQEAQTSGDVPIKVRNRLYAALNRFMGKCQDDELLDAWSKSPDKFSFLKLWSCDTTGRQVKVQFSETKQMEKNSGMRFVWKTEVDLHIMYPKKDYPEGKDMVARIVASARSQPHPDPRFRKDKAMRLYRVLAEKSESEMNRWLKQAEATTDTLVGSAAASTAVSQAFENRQKTPVEHDDEYQPPPSAAKKNQRTTPAHDDVSPGPSVKKTKTTSVAGDANPPRKRKTGKGSAGTAADVLEVEAASAAEHMQTFAKYINQIRLLQQRCLKQKENRRAMLLGEGLSAVRAQLEKVDEQMAGLAEGSPEEIAALWASAGGPACKAAKEEIELATSMLP